MNTAILAKPKQKKPRPINDYFKVIAEVVQNVPSGDSAFFQSVTWIEYERLLKLLDHERSDVRLTFDEGRLEIMTIHFPHESGKSRISRIVEFLTLALRMPMRSAGSMTIRRMDLDAGFEPDACYYIRNVNAVMIVRDLDFTIDPPPDLAIEIESSRRLIDRIPLYAKIGIPEVWRCTDSKIEVLLLDLTSKKYIASSASNVFPHISIQQIQSFYARGREIDDTTLGLEMMDWVQANGLTKGNNS